MSRLDILRKVRGLIAIAEDVGAPEGERSSASSKAIALRLKYGISDTEVEQAKSEPLVFFGADLMYWTNNIAPHFDRIKDEIESIQQKISELKDVKERARHACKLYKTLHDITEEEHDWAKYKVKWFRNEAVKVLYKELFQEEHTNQAKYSKPASSEEELLERECYAHKQAITWVAMPTDLRRDTIERIVGRSEKALKQHLRKLYEKADAAKASP